MTSSYLNIQDLELILEEIKPDRNPPTEITVKYLDSKIQYLQNEIDLKICVLEKLQQKLVDLKHIRKTIEYFAPLSKDELNEKIKKRLSSELISDTDE